MPLEQNLQAILKMQPCLASAHLEPSTEHVASASNSGAGVSCSGWRSVPLQHAHTTRQQLAVYCCVGSESGLVLLPLHITNWIFNPNISNSACRCVFMSSVWTWVMGWLHVNESRSRMWTWLFHPRPGLSHCTRSKRHKRSTVTLQQKLRLNLLYGFIENRQNAKFFKHFLLGWDKTPIL